MLWGGLIKLGECMGIGNDIPDYPEIAVEHYWVKAAEILEGKHDTVLQLVWHSLLYSYP